VFELLILTFENMSGNMMLLPLFQELFIRDAYKNCKYIARQYNEKMRQNFQHCQHLQFSFIRQTAQLIIFALL